MNEPIMKFDETTLQESLDYWVEKLFLTDWVIHAKIVPPDEVQGDSGRNEFKFVIKSSLIKIADVTDEERAEFITKSCDEYTLIHELLHLKYNWLEAEDGGTYQQVYVDAIEHQLLDQMAKTLLMTKYNLPFSWFNNF